MDRTVRTGTGLVILMLVSLSKIPRTRGRERDGPDGMVLKTRDRLGRLGTSDSFEDQIMTAR